MRKKDICGSYVKNKNMRFCATRHVLGGQVQGYCALLHFEQGTRELIINYEDHSTRLSGEGYRWLVIMPMDEPWCLTALYDPQNQIIEWYFDISWQNFIDESGMPCMDDLYLDLVLLPDGRILMLDADELQEAPETSNITQEQFDFAYAAFERIEHSRWVDLDFINPLCSALLVQCTLHPQAMEFTI